MKQSSLWWKNAVIYQIYPRSFRDSNGDGVGDIQGIIEKLDYLKNLGVDALWLSPVYVSPNNDFGYDIANYTDINPEYGTLDDMKLLITEADKRGMRIIMDMVINHTSSEHPWFKDALNNPSSPYRDYYIWRDGQKGFGGKEKAPNNWTSFFTGSAWSKESPEGQYYLHLFTEQQPDLNYRNPKVLQEVKNILTFWLDLGVAGFRCDVINILSKESFADGKRRSAGAGREFYLSTPGTHTLLKELHGEILEPRGAFTVGEATFATLQHAKDFTAGDELNTVFGFEHVEHSPSLISRTSRLRRATIKWQQELSWNTVFLENHDQPRSVSVLGNTKKYHYESATMLASYLLTLKGTPFIYQGQEIGMTNYPFRDITEAKDPVTKFIFKIMKKSLAPEALATKLAFSIGRDNARTPMQWDDSRNAGFSSAEHTWMPVNPNSSTIHAKDSAVLAFYKNLITLRKENSTLHDGDIRFIKSSKNILIFDRFTAKETVRVYLNLSARKSRLPYPISDTILLQNSKNSDAPKKFLQPYEAIITTKYQ